MELGEHTLGRPFKVHFPQNPQRACKPASVTHRDAFLPKPHPAQTGRRTPSKRRGVGECWVLIHRNRRLPSANEQKSVPRVPSTNQHLQPAWQVGSRSESEALVGSPAEQPRGRRTKPSHPEPHPLSQVQVPEEAVMGAAYIDTPFDKTLASVPIENVMRSDSPPPPSSTRSPVATAQLCCLNPKP